MMWQPPQRPLLLTWINFDHNMDKKPIIQYGMKLHPFPYTIKVAECIITFIPHLIWQVLRYPLLGLMLMHVSKRDLVGWWKKRWVMVSYIIYRAPFQYKDHQCMMGIPLYRLDYYDTILSFIVGIHILEIWHLHIETVPRWIVNRHYCHFNVDLCLKQHAKAIELFT